MLTISSRVFGVMTCCEPLVVDAEVVDRKRHAPDARAGKLGGRTVGVVARIEQDHFLACADDGVDCREDRFGPARRHRNLCARVDPPSVPAQRRFRNRLAECRQARHRRVLVVARAEMTGDELAQALRRIEIREALAEIDCAGLGGEPGHHREDRGSDAGQLRGRHHSLAAMAR